MPAFHYLPIASSFLSGEEFERIAAEYAGALARVGGVRVGPESIGTPARLAFFVLTGGTERRILELRAARATVAPDEPTVLVAYAGRNSLPAALEVLARLQQDGAAGSIVFLDGPWHEPALGSPGEGGRPLDPDRVLRGRRIGLVGAPSDWLVASSPTPSLVRDTWGAEVVEIGMGELAARVDAADATESAGFAAAFRAGATATREPRDADLSASARIYVALRSLVDELGLDAVTVRCFDLVTERAATACLALSRLADEGIAAGCEGDLVSALAMLWVRERTGEPSWMANPARVDARANAITLAHCTIPACMVSGYALRSHFESGLGAAVQGSVPTGPVTLLRIGGKKLDRLWLAEGEVVASGAGETMCRTQVRVRLGAGYGAAADLLERPLGNHLVLARGRVAGRLLSPPMLGGTIVVNLIPTPGS
jgi:L-fucose isomerase-like protein